MLQIREIHKEYKTGALVQKALDGVSLSFRDHEFVAVLGPSGSGKTTLLNIIGGLDHSDSGQLIIDGVPTQNYRSRDWDAYRNHSVGFIFQSYNLIPHQNLLANVELAMTLAGVKKKERRARAAEALASVGLAEQMHKKPDQLSGGQMQRVAIARALVNQPSIVLADEPTGALDSENGEQVMHLLKEVSKDHLVVMVTHNPELAERFATRIIRLRDGRVITDSDPYDPEAPEAETEESAAASVVEPERAECAAESEAAAESAAGRAAEEEPEKSGAARAVAEEESAESPAAEKPGIKTREKRESHRSVRKPSMSRLTALSLSVSNLLSKKTRTVLVAFAASIGITGIALILSLSAGAHRYIQRMEEDSLSEYPLQISSSTFSMESSMAAMAQMGSSAQKESEENGEVQEQQVLGAMFSGADTNDLASLRRWFESGESGIEDVTRCVTYSYGISPQIYLKENDGYRQVNPDQTMNAMGLSMDDDLSGMMSVFSGTDVFFMLPENEEIYQGSYELLAGHWPQSLEECVLVLMPDGTIPDYLLYTMGLKDAARLDSLIQSMKTGEKVSTGLQESGVYVPEDFLDISFRILPANRRFTYDEKLGVWVDCEQDTAAMTRLLDRTQELHISAVVRSSGDSMGILQPGICYTTDLMRALIGDAEESEVVQAQLKDPDTDVLTGAAFGAGGTGSWSQVMELAQVNPENLPDAVSFDWEGLDKVLEDKGRLSAVQTVHIIRELSRTGESPTLRSVLEEMLPALMDLVEIDPDRIGDVISLELDESHLQQMYAAAAEAGSATYSGNLIRFGYADPEKPGMITIYPNDFESKEEVIRILDAYNSAMKKTGHEEQVISYTDYVGSLMSSVTTIIDVITYVLIAFVAVSLVVSSIMIGIITYISVLERRKEIGILRAMGASRRNIAQVFNAETFIIGILAGAIGIALTLLLQIPLNAAIHNYTDQPVYTYLPAGSGAVLILLCVLLNMTGGFIPSRRAARQDPVEALRSE